MRLLQIELLKLGRVGNYVLLAIMLLLTAGATAFLFYALKKGGATDIHLADLRSIFDGMEMMLSIILAIFLSLNIGKEFSDSTLRRSVIDGHTRSQFYNGKLLLVLASAFFVYLVFNAALWAGGLYLGNFGIVKDYYSWTVIITPFLNLLSTGIFVLFLAFVTRSVAISIIIYLTWWLVIENATVYILKMVEASNDWHFEIERYLPRSSITEALSYTDIAETKVVIVAVMYLLLMLLVSFGLFIKRDIK